MTTITIQPSRITLPLHPNFRPKPFPINHARKITRRDAQLWVRARLTPKLLGRARAVAVVYYPSTPQLRRWLTDKTTPRGVKGHLWSMLLYRLRTAR